jgi:cyclophilin family peptidyl-prolyl cis-trans isomerase
MKWFCPSLCLAAVLSVVSNSSWAGTLAQFRTPIGDLEVELFDADKPITVQNFLRYVTSGAYSNMFMHRWVPGFVVQGGGFQVIKHSGTNVIDSIPIFGTITNEYGVGRKFSNVYGTLAMARVGGLTNSASSQWFFNLATNTPLDSVDGGFSVFGRVLRGTNILNRFNNTSVSNSIYRLQLGGALNELPVLKGVQPGYQDLVYVDVSLLNVHVVSNGRGGRNISWTTVSNVPNHLEFTTNFPPAWKILTSTNGTGKTMTVTDSAGGAPARFYRVRVDYQ